MSPHSSKASDKPTKQASPKKQRAQKTLQAASQFVMGKSAQQPQPALESLLDNASKIKPPAELTIARQLNVDFTDNPVEFVHLLEDRINQLTGCQKSVMLILDEDSGTYRCLNDEGRQGVKPRELTWVSDNFLQDILESQSVIYTYLCDDQQIFGIVAIADKQDGTALSLADQLVLEQMAPYLSVQLKHYIRLRESLMIPAVQHVLLNISNQLLGAVDSTAIFKHAFEGLLADLPFEAAQYVVLDKRTGKGKVNYQLHDGRFMFGKVIQRVEGFNALLSLFASQVWNNPYLQLKGSHLGDKAFDDMFGLTGIQSVVLVPMNDGSGNLQGALVLFQLQQERSLSPIVMQVVEEVAHLVDTARERARVLEKAMEIATTDELTRTLNRRGFYTACHAEVDRARRNKRDMVLAIIDLDHFKGLNDTYGHMVGDTVLKKVAERLMKNIRKSDILCRFGGEEFTLVLPETNLTHGLELLDRLRQSIEKYPIATPIGPIKVTFSAGVDEVALFGEFQRKSAMEVISRSMARADEALYKAKHQGRNKVVQA